MENRTSDRCSVGLRSIALNQRSAWAAISVGLIIGTAAQTNGQGWQYSYDLSGNLIIQASETVLPPQILGQPQLQVVQTGDLVSFSVVLADTSAVSYQWWFNGAYMLGQRNQALLLTNVESRTRANTQWS